MKNNQIKFNFNLASDPERDATILVRYAYYYGHGMGSDDPSEIDILTAVDENGIAVPIEEIQGRAEEKILEDLKSCREDSMYSAWKERNL